MARNPSLKHQRDLFVLERYRFHRKRNPKWIITEVIIETAKEVYLSPATVNNILKKVNEPKVPATKTVAKYMRQNSAA